MEHTQYVSVNDAVSPEGVPYRRHRQLRWVFVVHRPQKGTHQIPTQPSHNSGSHRRCQGHAPRTKEIEKTAETQSTENGSLFSVPFCGQKWSGQLRTSETERKQWKNRTHTLKQTAPSCYYNARIVNAGHGRRRPDDALTLGQLKRSVRSRGER